MGAARLQRQQRNRRVISYAHPRSAGSAIEQRVRDWRDAVVRLPRQHEDAMRAGRRRPANGTRKIIDNPHPERFADVLQMIAWTLEQCFDFVVVHSLNSIAAKAHADASGARSWAGAPQAVELSRRPRLGGGAPCENKAE